MRDSATLLSSFESCNRAGHWTRDWEKHKLLPHDMLDIGIRAGLEFDGPDFGEEAGAVIYELGATRGIDSDQYEQHAEVVHVASLADIITCAIRKKSDAPWKRTEPVDGWISDCYMAPDGNSLRLVVCVTSWNDQRHNSLCRSWQVLGPVANYDLPMQIAVAMIGAHREGRYHSFWGHALQHPQNKKLRFRKKTNIGEGFKSTWLECWRFEHDELDAYTWLDAMMGDDVLRDVCFRIDMPRLEASARNRIIKVAKRKLEIIQSTVKVPDEQFTNCTWPVKCPFLSNCWKGDQPSGRYGFIRIT